jgi:hypothetical protein
MGERKELVLCLSYARSGGTMLSQVLGHHSDVILFSEINPSLNAVSSIQHQAKEWYGINLKESSFLSSIDELMKHPCTENKKVVIRDFSFIDFSPHALNYYDPINHFGIIEALKEQFDLKVFAFIRDAFDVWISRDCPPNFSEHYLSYIQEIKQQNIQVFKYEDFCKDAANELEKLSRFIGVQFEKECLKGVKHNIKTTGDTDLEKSRGRNIEGAILNLKRKQLPKRLRSIAQNDRYLLEANRLVNYSEDIRSKEVEKISKLALELKWLYRRITKKHPTAKF